MNNNKQIHTFPNGSLEVANGLVDPAGVGTHCIVWLFVGPVQLQKRVAEQSIPRLHSPSATQTPSSLSQCNPDAHI